MQGLSQLKNSLYSRGYSRLQIIILLVLVLSLPLITIVLVKQQFYSRQYASSTNLMESENGTLANGSIIGNDSNASGGEYIQFAGTQLLPSNIISPTIIPTTKITPTFTLTPSPTHTPSS